MAKFDAKTLSTLRDVREVAIRTGTCRNAATIWVTVSGDQVFVRSWSGANGRWYRGLAAGGPATLEFGGRCSPVQAIPASDPDSVARANHEYLKKYRLSSHAREMVRAEILSTTLRLEPR